MLDALVGELLELCPGHRVTITQKYTTEAERELWHADGRPFNYLDVDVSVPSCYDAYQVCWASLTSANTCGTVYRLDGCMSRRKPSSCRRGSLVGAARIQ